MRFVKAVNSSGVTKIEFQTLTENNRRPTPFAKSRVENASLNDFSARCMVKGEKVLEEEKLFFVTSFTTILVRSCVVGRVQTNGK